MRRCNGSKLVHALAGLVVVVGSVAVALVLFELVMQYLRQDRVAMRVAPASYGVFDTDLGVRYQPDTAISFAYLDSKGRVLDCLPNVSVTNSDGFRGLDKRADYFEATQRIIATGDSFSHWNNDGLTIVDHTKIHLGQLGFDVSLLNVAGGTFGLEHMVVHVAAAIDETHGYSPDLVAIQFIRDDITRGWWYLDTVTDRNGRLRARLGQSLDCLAPGSDCGSDEYLIDTRVTQEWCTTRKGTVSVDETGRDLVSAYRQIRGFFVYVRKAFARLGLLDMQATSVIPRVMSVRDINGDRVREAVSAIESSGAEIMLVYLPTEVEIRSGAVYTLDENEKAILQFYEETLGVQVLYPKEFSSFEGVTEFAVSPADGHPSAQLQNGYGRYLATMFADALR